MAPTNAVELTTEDFGRWARRAGLAFPVPLNSGHAARVELDWDELLAASEVRLTVTNAVARPEPDRSPALRDMLRYAAGVLGAPAIGLYAVRTDLATATETMAIGLSAGSDGLVVVDAASSTRLVRLPATELASAVAAALPALRGFPLQRFELNGRALATLHGDGRATPSGRAISTVASASGLPPEWLEDLLRVQQAATAGGLLGAVRYRDGDAVPGAVSARWFEGPTGSVLRREGSSGDVSFEPATRTTLTSALVAASAAPATPVRRGRPDPDDATLTTNDSRRHTLGGIR